MSKTGASLATPPVPFPTSRYPTGFDVAYSATQSDAPVTRYLTEVEAADLTRFSAGHLRNMRSQRRGPAFIRVGSSIRYRLDDLLAWMETGAA